jgi:hypothetical protein
MNWYVLFINKVGIQSKLSHPVKKNFTGLMEVKSDKLLTLSHTNLINFPTQSTHPTKYNFLNFLTDGTQFISN